MLISNKSLLDLLQEQQPAPPRRKTLKESRIATTDSAPSQAHSEVHYGDAFDMIDSLPKNSIDMVVTSPPYWGMRVYGLDHNWDVLNEWKKAGHGIDEIPDYQWYRRAGGVLGLEPLPEWYVAHLIEFFSKLAAPLKQAGSLWINIGDTYFTRWSSIRLNGRQGLGGDDRLRRRGPMGGIRQEKNLLLLPSRFAIAMQERRWILRNDLIWFKPNVPPRPERDRLRLSHEHFFHFVKRPKEGRAKYYYDLSAVEPGAHDVVTRHVKAGENGHSATFPEDLVLPRIVSSCPPGGMVLDPFCGTGRALSATVSCGRSAIGFELAPHYAQAARGSAEGTTRGE